MNPQPSIAGPNMKVLGQVSKNPGPAHPAVQAAVDRAKQTARDVLEPSREARRQYMIEHGYIT